MRRIPIRTSRDRRVRAPTPSLSQLATSFISPQAEQSSYCRLCTGLSATYYTTIRDDHRRAPLRGGRATPFIRHSHGALHPMHARRRGAAGRPLGLPDGAVRAPANHVRGVTKEVIRPQVPLRSPCYDFSLVAYLKFDNANETPPR